MMMRKLFCLLTCICLAVCASCSDVTVKPVTTGFRCCLQMDYNGISIEARLDCRDASQSVIELTSPEELKGLRLLLTDNGVKIEYFGMMFDIPEEYEKETHMLSIVSEALRTLSGQDNGEDKRFVFDETSGLPLLFSFPEDRIEVRFSDWETSGSGTAV